jgi:hypothetical protein
LTRTLGSVRGAPGNGRPYRECAQHDQQLGGASPLWRLMAPTTSRRQLRRCEAGWEGSRRRSRDPRNTWCNEAVRVLLCCAYKAGRSGRASNTWRSPMSIKGLSRRRGGCAMKVAGLTWGDLHGCPRCLVRMVRVVRDGGVREGAARRGEVSRGHTTGGDQYRRKGPNAKPSDRTSVLVGVALTAANPFGGLAGRV